jgi:hypothetical protein
VVEHQAAEARGEAEVQRQVEPAPPASEVLVQLVGGDIQPPRGVQDPRADPRGQGLQHLIVAFARVGDPDQARLGRRQQQRPHRRVERAVGHIEQAVGVRAVGQPVVQTAQLRLGNGRVGVEQVPDLPGSVAGHRVVPF